MLAVRAIGADPENPLRAVQVGEVDDSDIDSAAPRGWVCVRLRAMALNQHDLWSLRGVGLPVANLPMVLGCDGAGVTDDGREVIIHSVISSPDWPGEESLDPRRSILSERHNGTFAERVWVPARNLLDKPPELSFQDAACLPVAWLTAYRMLFTNSGAKPGATILVQGAGGGVSTALIALGAATGFRMWATSRSEGKRERALELGADQVFAAGERLPDRVDAVMESVGKATWAHSLRAVRPGGTVVVCGATTGDAPAELNRVFFQQLRVIGSTMGSRAELELLARLCVTKGIRPAISSVHALSSAAAALEELAAGTAFGKIVMVP
jgi:NADPH:quinone reductase-like Zn-dependent oxidoreductase